ncbi:hypothetical protein FIM81_04460 [Helicobacter pylori]|uniref:Uncharacterized protein n=1 Tax=Helicobacter pylori TaxID=210 RepID=A0A2T6V192_HELPX|nr:hypothetical protein C2R72_08630 [Helicobacter pylori]RVY46271.1 hypothetical protein ECC25_04100 [Helicobacter pylori]TPH40713.1 hypothetical protein FIM81_04460 [Helicobacter pylori]TPI07623.1 hypothetical protein FIM34_04280 [Helicobacter pylori]
MRAIRLFFSQKYYSYRSMIIAQYSFKCGSKIKQIRALDSCFSNALKNFFLSSLCLVSGF